MWMIVIPLILGLVSAYFWPKLVSKLPIDSLILISLVLLLTVMGARLGADPEVMGQLGTLGLTAILLACLTVLGSVIVLVIINKISINKSKSDHTNLKDSDEISDNLTDNNDSGNNNLTIILVASVLAGILAGWIFLSEQILSVLESVTTWILGLLLLGVGLDLGGSDKFLSSIKQQGFKIVLFPFGVAIGSVIGSLFLLFFNTEILWNEVAAIASGFGWYSLSAVIISDIHSPMLGALAFLTNVFRELLAIVIIPTTAKYLGGIPAIGPGGATTMDVTLPIISKSAGKEYVPAAFVNGVTLSLLVPVLVNFFMAI